VPTSGTTTATAFWVSGRGSGWVEDQSVPAPGPDEVRVRTLWSAVSRGTEALVFRGEVPADQHRRMRAPFQDGDFPGPVKYGYLNVGVVEAGVADLVGRTVFCLYPHQTSYVVPADDVDLVPEGVPDRRAVLAGPVETAVNALWDVPPVIGDRVAVIGAGLIGCCVARLLGRVPGVEVTLVDVDPSRAEIARRLGVGFALPADAPPERDVVFHASGRPAGLTHALSLLADDGVVAELSWYGDTQVPLPLGGDFHARRLSIRGSQVGTVSPTRRRVRAQDWTPRHRRRLALGLLRDDAFDALLTDTSTLEDLPALMARIAAGDQDGLCHTIRHDWGDETCSS
jgi:threonine dehydrogenase-like Zn-dependent dehydrogenase